MTDFCVKTKQNILMKKHNTLQPITKVTDFSAHAYISYF